MLDFYFTGIDIFPQILSNRVESIWEIPGLFTRDFLSAYPPEQHSGTIGLRPVGMVTIAMDYWLWGLNPFGFHLTGLVIHTLNALLVFVLTRELLCHHAMGTGTLAAGLFALYPLHAATVPLITGRTDLLLCTFILGGLIAVLRYLRFGRARYLILVTLCFLLALLTKATAVVFIPIVIVTVGLAYVTGEGRRSLFRLMTATLVTVFAFLLYRSVILGGLGGYDVFGPNWRWLPGTVSRFFGRLIVPTGLASPGTLPAIVERLFAGLAALVFCMIVGLATVRLAMKRVRKVMPSRSVLSDDSSNIVLISWWVLAFYPMYAAIYLMTGHLKPLYLYTPAALWCIVLSAVIVRTALAALHLSSAVHRPSSWQRRFLAAAALILAAYALLQFARTPRLQEFDAWAEASAISEQYLSELAAALDEIEDRSRVFLANMPRGVRCARFCVGNSYLLEDYSVDAWAHLKAPDRELQFLGVSAIWLTAAAPMPISKFDASQTPTELVIRTWGGAVAAPWKTDAHKYFEVYLEPVAHESAPAILSMTATSEFESTTDGRAYVFDFLARPPLYTWPTRAPE
jgi:hypothetical protein